MLFPKRSNVVENHIGFLKDFCIWCAVVNTVVMFVWFLNLTVTHDFMYKQHSRWFQISEQKFDAIQYSCVAGFKLFIVFFNIVPYIALCIVY